MLPDHIVLEAILAVSSPLQLAASYQSLVSAGY